MGCQECPPQARHVPGYMACQECNEMPLSWAQPTGQAISTQRSFISHGKLWNFLLVLLVVLVWSIQGIELWVVRIRFHRFFHRFLRGFLHFNLHTGCTGGLGVKSLQLLGRCMLCLKKELLGVKNLAILQTHVDG